MTKDELLKLLTVLQAELEATNRQVEILSDALAESRREVASKDKALDLALRALETCEVAWPGTRFKSKYFAEDEVKAAITAIKQARALDKKAENARELGLDYEPVQEPVAIALNTGTKQGVKWLKNVEHGVSLYTTPPAAQQDIQRLSALVRAQQITIDKLEAAQPAPVQEPIKDRLDFWALFDENQRLRAELKFNTTPPAAQRQWVGLTPEDYKDIFKAQTCEGVVQLAENKLKEKNT